MKMDKGILKQYDDLRRELLDTKRRIKRNEEELQHLVETRDTAKDTVKGGEGGTRHYTVEGFPDSEYKRKKTLLMSKKIKLEKLEKKLDRMLDDVEEYINSVGNSRKRLILRYRYIDAMTWREIAKELGPGNNGDSVRMEISRFLERDGK
jgi:hypothetical protein